MVKKDKSDFIFIQENFCDDIIKAIEKETRIVYSIKVIDGVVEIRRAWLFPPSKIAKLAR